LARGDHFYVWRRFGLIPFQHHGIDLGDGTVVHFSNGNGGAAGPVGNASHFVISQMPLCKLTRGGKDRVHVITYPAVVPSSCSADATVDRAHSQLGLRGYHLFHDNCEHFATWCITRTAASVQVITAAERASSVAIKGSVVIAARIAMRSVSVLKPWMLAAAAVQSG